MVSRCRKRHRGVANARVLPTAALRGVDCAICPGSGAPACGRVVRMAKQEDIAAVRAAVGALDKAVSTLTRHYPESLDVERLRADTGRLSGDLDLLCGEQPVVPAAPVRPREIIADTSYAHDFWMDAEDEGLGRGYSAHGTPEQ